jgi:hypothetical protein
MDIHKHLGGTKIVEKESKFFKIFLENFLKYKFYSGIVNSTDQEITAIEKRLFYSQIPREETML